MRPTLSLTLRNFRTGNPVIAAAAGVTDFRCNDAIPPSAEAAEDLLGELVARFRVATAYLAPGGS